MVAKNETKTWLFEKGGFFQRYGPCRRFSWRLRLTKFLIGWQARRQSQSSDLRWAKDDAHCQRHRSSILLLVRSVLVFFSKVLKATGLSFSWPEEQLDGPFCTRMIDYYPPGTSRLKLWHVFRIGPTSNIQLPLLTLLGKTRLILREWGYMIGDKLKRGINCEIVMIAWRIGPVQGEIFGISRVT